MNLQKNATFIGIFAVLAVFGLLFTTCNNDTTGSDNPTVSGVTINITTSSVVEKGERLVFTATVTGKNKPGQGVNWSIDESYKNPQTAITPNNSAGVLYVSADETCNFLTIRATSTVNKSKSGTLVVAIYEPGQLPTVSTVTVSPSSASVAKGGTRTFTASVTGTNNPPNTVTWSIVQQNKHSGTAIDVNGKLTVSSAEALSSLTVKATSTVDNATSGTATVTVTNSGPLTPGNGSFSFPIGPMDVYVDEGYWDSANEVWVPQITKVTDGSYDGSYAYLERYDSDAKESSYTPLSAYINSPTTVQIQNNRLTVNLGTPKNLTAVADMMDLLLYGNVSEIEIKPANTNAKAFTFFGEEDLFCSQDGAFLFCRDYSEECYISFCYVDNDVTITGTVSDFGVSFALNLKRGWNYVKWTDTGYESPDFELYQTGQPGSDAKWFVNTWENGGGSVEPSLPRLAAPSNLQVSGTTLTWNAVENASSYLVDIGGIDDWTDTISGEYQADTNSYSLADLIYSETYTINTIKVKAIGDEMTSRDSPWSVEIHPASTPMITQQPLHASYFTGNTITALTVSATVSDGGEIGYQWYSSTTTSNSSLVAGWTSVGTTNGGNTKTFTPPATTGIVYYYALVTNTKTFTIPSRASSRATMINVTEPLAANFLSQPKSTYYFADIAEYDNTKENGKIIRVTPSANQPHPIEPLGFELDRAHSAAAGWKYQWYEANCWYGGYGFDADNRIIGEPGFSPDSSDPGSGYFTNALDEKSNVALYNGGNYFRYLYPGRPISDATGQTYTPVPDKRPFLSGLTYESHYYWVVITDPNGRKVESARATIITETDKNNHHFIVDMNNLKDKSSNRVSPKNPVVFTESRETYAIDLRGALPPGFDILDYSFATAQAKFFLVDGTPWIQNWTQGSISFIDVDDLNNPFIVLYYNLTNNNGMFHLNDGKESFFNGSLDRPFTHVGIMPSGDISRGFPPFRGGNPPTGAGDAMGWFCGFIELTELRFEGPSCK